jgi:hypothetical protein
MNIELGGMPFFFPQRPSWSFYAFTLIHPFIIASELFNPFGSLASALFPHCHCIMFM